MSYRKDFVFAKETRSPQQLSQLKQMENRDDSNQVVRKETGVPSLQKENSEQRRINRHETKMISKMISPGDSSLFRKLPSSGRSPDPPPATSSPSSPNLGNMVTGFFLPVQLFFLPTTKKSAERLLALHFFCRRQHDSRQRFTPTNSMESITDFKTLRVSSWQSNDL